MATAAAATGEWWSGHGGVRSSGLGAEGRVWRWKIGIIGGQRWRGPCCRFLGERRSVRNRTLRARAGAGTKRCSKLVRPAALASGAAAGAGCGFLVGVDAVFPGWCLW